MLLQIIIFIVSSNYYLSLASQGLLVPSKIKNDISICNFRIDNILNEKLIPISIIHNQLKNVVFSKNFNKNKIIEKFFTKELNFSKNDLNSAIKMMVFYR